MSAATYRSAWLTLSARIRGIERAAAVHASFLQVNNGSPYGADKDLQEHCAAVWCNIQEFAREYAAVLPPSVVSAIRRFGQSGGAQIEQNAIGDPRLLRTVLVKLIAFDAEVTYALNSPLEEVRSASELAFMHLQRLIVVDTDYRTKWGTAYAKHETHCERLGGVHLLWHGVFAFKVDATGGKSDLVYQEPLVHGMPSGARGFVLTEWKRADSASAADRFAEAREQTKQYSAGIMAGIELTSHRYLVVVTQETIRPPEDIVEGGVTYRHINIAVNPAAPSVDAKRLS